MSVYTEEDMTPWFPGSVSPEREGVYERRYFGAGGHMDFSRFNGTAWYVGLFTPGYAAVSPVSSTYQCGCTDFEWRGLAQDPNVVTITPEHVAVVKCDAPGLALDSGEFIPAAELNAQAAVDDEEQLF